MGRAPYHTLAERLERYSEPEPNTGCWLWFGYVERKGYGRFTVSGKRYLAHRSAYAIAYGELPADLCVMHKCDMPACVNPAHLTLGTYAENNHDRDRKGRHTPLHGSLNGEAKLNAEQVVAIRDLCASGESYRGVARIYGMSHYQIRRIALRESWKNVA